MIHFAYGIMGGNFLTAREVLTVFVAADARAAETNEARLNITALVGEGNPNDFVGRSFDIRDTSLVPLADPAVSFTRRNILRQNFLVQESAYKGVWEHRRFYELWLEANVRAAARDSNLTTNVFYERLLRESLIDGPRWYWAANREIWTAYYWDGGANSGAGAARWENPLNNVSWYQTVTELSDSTTPNSVAGTQRTTMQLVTTANFNYVRWLRLET